MITSNVIHRTFHIRYRNGTGTAFAIDRDGRQYLITARHLVEGVAAGDSVDLFHEKQWKKLAVDVVGIGCNGIDVTVLACPIQLAPPLPLEASSAGLVFGQPVYFLGFPFAWDSGLENINRGLPVPFVKAGVVSAMIPGNASHIYVDAHGNKGFSGGPVVFVPNGRQPNEFCVAGVVSNYPTPILEPVVTRSGDHLTDANNIPVAYFPENPGLIVAFDIPHATDMIKANPIGRTLPIG